MVGGTSFSTAGGRAGREPLAGNRGRRRTREPWWPFARSPDRRCAPIRNVRLNTPPVPVAAMSSDHLLGPPNARRVLGGPLSRSAGGVAIFEHTNASAPDHTPADFTILDLPGRRFRGRVEQLTDRGVRYERHQGRTWARMRGRLPHRRTAARLVQGSGRQDSSLIQRAAERPSPDRETETTSRRVR